MASCTPVPLVPGVSPTRLPSRALRCRNWSSGVSTLTSQQRCFEYRENPREDAWGCKSKVAASGGRPTDDSYHLSYRAHPFVVRSRRARETRWCCHCISKHYTYINDECKSSGVQMLNRFCIISMTHSVGSASGWHGARREHGQRGGLFSRSHLDGTE